MTGTKSKVFRPRKAAVATYAELYQLYHQLHNAFGTSGYKDHLYNVMKDLITIGKRVRQGSL